MDREFLEAVICLAVTFLIVNIVSFIIGYQLSEYNQENQQELLNKTQQDNKDKELNHNIVELMVENAVLNTTLYYENLLFQCYTGYN